VRDMVAKNSTKAKLANPFSHSFASI